MECQQNIDSRPTVKLFKSLGFVVHPEKSVLSPRKGLKYLGFYLNSENMTVTLPEERVDKIKKACTGLLSALQSGNWHK